jgi:hypothetical protein
MNWRNSMGRDMLRKQEDTNWRNSMGRDMLRKQEDTNWHNGKEEEGEPMSAFHISPERQNHMDLEKDRKFYETSQPGILGGKNKKSKKTLNMKVGKHNNKSKGKTRKSRKFTKKYGRK